jgi:hypothetical protein
VVRTRHGRHPSTRAMALELVFRGQPSLRYDRRVYGRDALLVTWSTQTEVVDRNGAVPYQEGGTKVNIGILDWHVTRT